MCWRWGGGGGGGGRGEDIVSATLKVTHFQYFLCHLMHANELATGESGKEQMVC